LITVSGVSVLQEKKGERGLTSVLEAKDLTGCYLIYLAEQKSKALSLEHRSFLHLTEIFLELLHLKNTNTITITRIIETTKHNSKTKYQGQY